MRRRFQSGFAAQLLFIAGGCSGIGAISGEERSTSSSGPTDFSGVPGEGASSGPAPTSGGGLAFGGAGGASGDTLGVTPGGAKDIGFARDVIKRGGVPDGKAITVEGLLSEHDIPVEGPECESLLCARPALGVALALDSGNREHFIQLGFTSGFHRDTFRRPPLDLVVLIDRSGSMAGDQREVNAAVTTLVDKMRDDDRLGILIFNENVETLFPFGNVADKEALKKKVAGIQARGGWDFEPAFDEAFKMVRAAGEDSRRLRRVMTFSCAYPQVSRDERDTTSRLIKEGAGQGIGVSFFGVLLGWNAELADLLGRTRGGAFYFLQSLTKVEQVFDADFDFMVTPVLHDLKIAVDPGARLEVVKIYGMPGMSADETVPVTGPPAPVPNAGQGQTGGAFLSSRRGAIVARLRVKAGEARGDTVGTVTLRYQPEPALGFGDAAVEEKVVVEDVDQAQWDADVYQGIGVHKAVLLTNQALRMRAACDAYNTGKRMEAEMMLTGLVDHLKAAAPTFGDELAVEIALVEQLLGNVRK